MFDFLPVFTGDIVIGVVCFALGMIFKTKVTDFFKGIPASLRTALNGLEADVVAKTKAAQAQVIASLPVAPAPAVKTPLAPAPLASIPAVAPVAAAPAAPASAPVAPVPPVA